MRRLILALWAWLCPEPPSCATCRHQHTPASRSPCHRCGIDAGQGRVHLTQWQPVVVGTVPPRPMPAPAPRVPRNLARVADCPPEVES